MLSKYQRISQDLIDKIDKQEIKVHSYLPSENELMKLYNGERVILDTDYLNANIVPNITETIAADSLYNYIENELGLKISFARKEFTVVKATEEEKNLLDMHEYDLLVCVKSYTYLEDASLFQYTISKHRPDKFRFVDFARRTQL